MKRTFMELYAVKGVVMYIKWTRIIVVLVFVMVQPLQGNGVVSSLKNLEVRLRSLEDALLGGTFPDSGKKKPPYGRRRPVTQCPKEPVGLSYNDLPNEVLEEIIKNVIPAKISSANQLVTVMKNLAKLELVNTTFANILRDKLFFKDMVKVLTQSIIQRGIDPQTMISEAFTQLATQGKTPSARSIYFKLLDEAGLAAQKIVDLNNRLINAASKGDLEGVISSLEEGANIEARDYYNETALLTAIRASHERPERENDERLQLIHYLLNKGAHINAKSSGRGLPPLTPLIAALKWTNPELRLKLVKMLLNYNPDLTITGYFGQTPLEIARGNNDIIIVQLIENWQRQHEERGKKVKVKIRTLQAS